MTYYTLISSLPHLPAHFDDASRPPISRDRLNERLKLLRDDDLKVLRQLVDFIAWDRQVTDRPESEIVDHYKRLTHEIKHPLVLEVIEHRMNARTIVSALRRRRDGLDPPTGVGNLVGPITRRWGEPQFGLQSGFPWIEDFNQKMLAGRAVAAERVLFEWSWQACLRLASQFTFSFDAVLMYLARWSIVDRWTSRSGKIGLERFDSMIEETLGEYATLKL